MTVRTVLGDVPATTLGTTDSHDHLFLRTPALPGEELRSSGAAETDLERFAQDGGRAVVQWSPAGAGRRLAALAAASWRTGVHVVAATGRHRRHLYAADDPVALGSREQLAARFVHDVRARGCGLVKVGTGPDADDAFEREHLLAAADAAATTGAPVAVHLDDAARAGAVLDLLAGAGAGPGDVVLGHVGRHAEPSVLLDAAASGAWLCLDLPSPAYGTTQDGLLGQVDLLASEGHLDRLLLGADTTTRSARDAGKGPSAVLRFVALAEARLGTGIAGAVLVANPARAWALRGVPS